MDFRKIWASPILARAFPYALIVVLTALQDIGGPVRHWLYLLKMLAGLWCIWEMRAVVPELRWAISWEAVLVGVGICVVWVGLDPYYPRIELLFKASKPSNPFDEFGAGSALAWFFAIVHILGSTVIVPPIEEAFYRSFIYRYLVRIDFTSLPFNHVQWLSLFVTSGLFGLVHPQWLAGILCGLAFQWLVIRKNRIGDAMTAHAITNFLLGVWVVWKGAWQFW